MDGIKIIPASEVIESGSRKKKKPIIKSDSEPKSKSSLIITKMTNIKVVDAKDVIISGIKQDNIVNVDTIKPKIRTINVVDNKVDDKAIDYKAVETDIKTCVGTESTTVQGRIIRAIKLKESIYYGENDINKKTFVKMYKSKKLLLKWTENINIDGAIVSCWTNQDRTQYIIKLLEEGGYKRFKFYGCDDIYDFFIKLGAIPFDHTKENSTSPSYLSNYTDKEKPTGIIPEGDIEDQLFIGADLWSGYRTRQLLKNMPENWGVIW